MITKRTLERWKMDALVDYGAREDDIFLCIKARTRLNKRILRLTQELLDLHLTKKRKEKSA